MLLKCKCQRILALTECSEETLTQSYFKCVVWGHCPFCGRPRRRVMTLNEAMLEQFAQSLASICTGFMNMEIVSGFDSRLHPEREWVTAMVVRMRRTDPRRYSDLKIVRLLAKRGISIDKPTVRLITNAVNTKRIAYHLGDPPPWCHRMTDVRLRAWFGAPVWEKFQDSVQQARPDNYLAAVLSTRTDIARYCKQFLQGTVSLKVVPKRWLFVTKPEKMTSLCPFCHIRSCRRLPERCKMVLQSKYTYKFLQTGIETPK